MYRNTRPRAQRSGLAVAVIAGTSALMLASGANAANECGVQDFEITVSLEADPQSDSDRARYEEILQDFADTVYAATEAQHRITKVDVWPSSLSQGQADVIWSAGGLAMASANGLRRSGLRLYMADVLERPDVDEDDPTANDLSLVFDLDVNQRSAGNILAHEWAHYAYGLRDEHEVDEGDIPVEPSLMNSPWDAATDFAWRNFSIPGAGGPYEDTGETEHHRQFERSGWDVLSESEIALEERLLSPTPGFVERCPQGLLAPGGVPASDESAPAVEVVWRDLFSSFVILVDNSGSMAGSPLTRAKEVAATLINSMDAGSTCLTVVTFHDTAVPRHGPFLVDDEADDFDETERDRFLTAIDDIASVPNETVFSRGITYAFDLADTAEDECSSPISTHAMFFVSDGSNSGSDVDLDTALADYAALERSIYALNVAADATTIADLIPLVSSTDGIAFGPAATTPQALEAITEAETLLVENRTVEAGTFTVEPTDRELSVPILTDSTIARLRICATSTEPLEFTFRSPSGVSFLPGIARTREEVEGAEDLCNIYFAVGAPGSGTWEMVVAPDDEATGPIEVTFEAVVTPRNATYLLDAWVTGLDDPGAPVPGAIAYPAPMIVNATLWNERPIAGAQLVLSVDDGPTVTMLDDGLPPDILADDGHYAAVASYDSAGCAADPDVCPVIAVQALNALGSAFRTSNGLILAPNPNGTTIDPEPDEFIGEDIDRRIELVVPTVADTTPMTLVDEEPLDGRVENTTDLPDRFSIDLCGVLPTLPDPLEVRVSGALLGMRPHLEVFLGDPDAGTPAAATGTAAPGEGGVTVVIDTTGLTCASTIYADVSHADGGIGTYQISAGQVLSLEFGRAGEGDSPCRQALLDQEIAIEALDDGVDGLEFAALLLTDSEAIEQDLLDALADLPDPTKDEKRSSKRLKKAIKKVEKAQKLIVKIEDKAGEKPEKDLKRIGKLESRIESARETLEDACSTLQAGGAFLLTEPS